MLYTVYLYTYYSTQKSNAIAIDDFNNLVNRYKNNTLITPYTANITLDKDSKAEDLNISAIAYYLLK